MRKILLSAAFVLAATTSTFASHTASTSVLGVTLPNTNAIVDSVLGKEPPQGYCYEDYHVQVINRYNAKGKYVGKEVTCAADE